MSKAKLQRMLLVDDHKLFREGVAALLKEHFPGVDVLQASSGPEALRVMREQRIDLVLLDIALPGDYGVAIAQRILEGYASIKIIVLTQHRGNALLATLMRMGVHGFVFKNDAVADLQRAIRTVMNGEQCFPDEVKSALFKSLAVTPAPTVTFTYREAQILLQLRMGRSSKEIAAALALKENTIRSYRDNLLHRTGARNVAELVSFVYENGLVS